MPSTPFFYLLFSASNISPIKLKVAFTVDDFVLKPDCLFTNTLLVFKCWYIHTYMTFSKTFENEVDRG